MNKEQKAKLKALKTEISSPIKITFKDQQQDFLTWFIKQDGTILESRPLQGWLWTKAKVMNVETLREGGEVLIQFPGEDTVPVKYPIEKIERVSWDELKSTKGRPPLPEGEAKKQLNIYPKGKEIEKLGAKQARAIAEKAITKEFLKE